VGGIRLRPRRALVTCGALVLGLAGVAAAEPQASREAQRVDGGAAAQSQAAQHGPSANHLPAVSSNMSLVSKLQVTENIDGIADVAVHEGFAYLNAWDGECRTPDNPATNRGGVHVVDMRDPAKPVKVGYLPASADTYHGEGAHAISVDTPAFKGDLLAVNNESCTNFEETEQRFGAGGMDLYDVSDPLNPKLLLRGFGDRGGEGELTGDAPKANSSHSTFMWQAGERVYVVQIDNWEWHDVDIFDITNPSAPQPVGEYDLVEYFGEQGIDIVDSGGLGNLVLHHDNVVRRFGDRYVMVASYWDAGYVGLDVTDPANPQYIGDSTFEGPDPFTGLEPQEGNAHQGEFSHDGRFFLAADEDFAPYRSGSFSITTGPNAGEYPATEVSGGASPASLPDRTLNGPTVYGGYGCLGSDPAVPQRSDFDLDLETGEEAILVLQRGPSGDPDNTEEACFPGEKAAAADEAGWDAVLLVNRHLGSAEADSPSCGSGGYPPGSQIVTLCTTHEAFHRLFGMEPQYDDDAGNPDHLYTPGDEPDEPDDEDVGRIGERVEGTSIFDGWGYAHLYKPGEGKWTTVDHWAIEESMDPRFAFGFGDLSIHEFATDPTEYLAYSAYYAGGLRTVAFGDDGMRQVGAFIDEGGSNFWGVEQTTGPDGQRLIVGSDRDYGLYVVRYDGPGAARPPQCEDIVYATSRNTPVEVELFCSDENGNPLTLSIDRRPENGTVGEISGNKVTYTPRAEFAGRDTFTFRAHDGAASSAPATVTVLVGECANQIEGTDARDMIIGTAAGDAIYGRAGNDIIDGVLGGDCLLGEAGADQLDGGAGDDQLFGGDERDRLFGGSGDDQLRGGRGVDHLRGSSGDDRLYGQGGRDFVSGGSNNDRVSGGAGNDNLRGEAGHDALFGGGGNDKISTGPGRDKVSGGRGKDRINAANGARNVIRCGPGRDRVRADRDDRVAADCEVVRRTRLTRKKG
jgi:hypothetical protein